MLKRNASKSNKNQALERKAITLDKNTSETKYPTRPEKFSVELIESDKGLTIVKRKGAGGGTGFLLLWLIGWTVACVLLATQLLSEPSIFALMFGTPFWASWIFVAGVVVWQIYGKELIRADHDGIFFERYAWIRISQRSISRKEILGFDKCSSLHTENDEHLWGVEGRTLGKPLRFLFGLPTDDLTWLVHRLNDFYGTQSTDLDLKLAPLVLTKENSMPKPPSGCRWELERDSRAIHFRSRGQINWGALLMSLFVCLFWNGIVSVFVLALLGLTPTEEPIGQGEWWVLFFFLIPFEIVGAGVLFAFLLNLFKPLNVITWEITRKSIIGHTSWPFASFQKTRPFKRLDRIELRENDGQPNWTFKSSKTSGDNFSLVLIDHGNSDFCTISDLTHGEARWLAYQIRTYSSHWFDSVR